MAAAVAGTSAQALQAWSTSSAGPPAALCAAAVEVAAVVVGDFQEEASVGVLVVALEVKVLLTSEVAEASP